MLKRPQMVAPRRKPWLLVLLRTVVLALVLPLASSFALPAWVALVAPETHLCHCPKDHSDCHCAKCHTDDPDLALTLTSISGHCGDEDVLFGASKMIAVLPAPVLVPVVVVSVAELPSVPPPSLTGAPRSRPPTPPPRLPS